MKIWPNEFEAHGTHVGIIPLCPAHAPDLEAVIAKSNLHKLLYVAIPEPTKIMQEIKRRNRLRVEGSMQPFAVIDKRTDRDDACDRAREHLAFIDLAGEAFDDLLSFFGGSVPSAPCPACALGERREGDPNMGDPRAV